MQPVDAVRRFLAKYSAVLLSKTGARQWILVALVFITLALMLVSNLFPESADLAVGQVARRDIEAPYRVVNRYQTDLQRSAAAREAEERAVQNDVNYMINSAAAVQAEERVAAAFAALRAARPQGEELSPDRLLERIEAVWVELRDERGLEVSRDALQAALTVTVETLARAEQAAASLARRVMESQRITAANLAQVRQGLAESLTSDQALSPQGRVAAVGIVQSVLRPNLVLDPRRVEQARAEAAAEVREVYVEQGQIIIRRGDLVEAEHIALMQDLGLLRTRTDVWVVMGMLLSVALLLAWMGVYLYQHEPDLLRSERLLSLLGLLLVVVSGLIKLAGLIPFEGTAYLIPVALATMLIAILLDSRVALMSAVFLAIVALLVFGDVGGKVMLVALVSGMTGVFSVSRISQRADLTRAGLVVGASSFVTMLALGLVLSDNTLITYAFLGLVNGVVSAVGAIGLLPYLESVFGITSSIRLLELSNPNHPLLRKLLMEAPGTYHHSMIVGNLAEAAAEAVGGDSLLARVASQFHDVGKTKRPYFFVENQFSGENPHDKISPSLSTLIITSHTKDGVELARQYKLPEVIIHFIREHHGTDLVKYFYHRAMENAQGEIDPSDFRYSGPKPQSKESAIVMLADSVEAAVRSLQRPTPGRIEGLVRKIIKDRLADGQLDESDVTLRDLDQIAEAFVRVLNGIFHHRVEYPENVLKEMEARRA